MTLLDSSVWVEILTNGLRADAYRRYLDEAQEILVPSIVLYEVFKRLLSDLDEEAALLAVAWMSQGQEVVLDRRIALEAAQIARERRLAMANSLILATARLYDAILWTQDAHFKGMEGVNYIEKQG